MDPFNGTGVFWLDSDHNDRVAGTLSFHPAEGISLELIGRFGDMGQRIGPDTQPKRILGVAGNKLVTLVDAVQSGFSFNAPGIMRESYRASVLLLGGHIPTELGLRFTALFVQVDHLDAWIANPGTSVTWSKSEDAAVASVTYEYRQPELETAALPAGGTVEVGTSFRAGGDDLTESFIRQNKYVAVKPTKPVELEMVFRLANHLQNLVSMAATTSCAIRDLTVEHPDVYRDEPAAQALVRLAVCAPMTAEPSTQKRHTQEMLFTYAQMGRAEGLAKWLGVAERYQLVIATLMSVRHSRRMYVHNRFQNVALAAEAFHRLRFPNQVDSPDVYGKRVRRVLGAVPPQDRPWLERQLTYSNEPSLRRRLKDLARHAGAPFKELVGDVARWSHLIAQVRNALTHPDDERADLGGLYYLSESVYVVVVLCLLREADASDEVLSSVPGNTHIAWLTRPLREALDEAARAFS